MNPFGALYPPVRSPRTIAVQYVSCAVHPGGLSIFELKEGEDPREAIGVGDDLTLSIKKLSNGLMVALKSSVTGETRSRYVLLQVQREYARLGRWPVWSFLWSMPWRVATIPYPGVWASQLRSQVRPPLSIRRFFEPESPDVREIRALLAQYPNEFTIEVLTEDGYIHEVAMDGSDADVAV
ncbi:uncharacterized protein TRAVEDRAFT_27317 [Trametes versicolor FP-101664 SS1]|uniref:uncharacterized protein n=1 Tax=Trametes versicolor (strain FP-101664) TaxID=717944 RepID=UPI000462274B|nr:uncharacterized protein TRAVEDRAFT_27317 [Trametes versicolor FP-101664 SS1]EIW61866.1 hypothetical protein TRAVEDRAFT_27317 [Trametes versicolor FP-101664 SS1]